MHPDGKTAELNRNINGAATALTVNRLAEAIAAGQLDAAVAWAPYHEEVAAAAPGGGVVFYPGQIYTANWLVVVDSDFAQRRPEDVTRYLRALLAAEEVVRSQPELVARTVAPIVATAPEELLKLYDVVDFDLELSEAVLLNLSLQAAWAVRRGYVPQDSPADMRALFNVEHLRRVKPNAVLLLD
jgi:ABC-type nitrate/sulfonate/bicarbonate transport system substrate-binding protein